MIAGEVYAPPEPAQVDPIPEVTATVTPGLSPAGVQAAKVLVHLPKDLDYPTLAKLAREVAMDIKERSAILQEYKLTQTQYEFLEGNNEFFKSALAAACREWHAPMSTPERIKIEAAAILEDSLPGLGSRMQNRSEGLPGVVEAAKLFAKVAGVGEREAGAGNSGERFTINIDLGGDQKLVVATGPAPLPAGNSNSAMPLPQLPPGESSG